MTFVVRKMRYEDLDFIYLPALAEEVFQATRVRKEWWPRHVYDMHWIVDVERHAYVLQLPIGLGNAFGRYLFANPLGVIVCEYETGCRFRLEYMSAPALRSFREMTAMAAEGLRKTGLVPHAFYESNDPSMPKAEFF